MIRLSPEAEADLRDIADWIGRKNSAAVALRVYDRIVASLRSLDRFALMARVGRVPGTRELVVTGLPYIAVYQTVSDGVLIVRIIHGAMCWPQDDP